MKCFIRGDKRQRACKYIYRGLLSFIHRFLSSTITFSLQYIYKIALSTNILPSAFTATMVIALVRAQDKWYTYIHSSCKRIHVLTNSLTLHATSQLFMLLLCLKIDNFVTINVYLVMNKIIVIFYLINCHYTEFSTISVRLLLK